MSEPRFFPEARPLDIHELADLSGATILASGRPDLRISGTAPLDRAGPEDLVFLDNPRYAAELQRTRAGACFLSEKHSALAPAGLALLLTPAPYLAFAKAAIRLYPESMHPQPVFGTSGVSSAALVHPTARLEPGVAVDPGAVVGPGAEIGAGTTIGANAVVGAEVRIGRDGSIGAGATILHSLIGDRVIVHPGARLGQDGFGFALGARHLKVPQLGRVVIQDDVEIGAGTTIDRGANRETVVGEGTKIDNLVQIAHNVVIGRHCVIVAQVGISGSTTIGDYAILGGKVGVVGHVHIGAGAQVAAGANVIADVPAGARWGGHIAQPMRDWLREVATLRRITRRGPDRAQPSPQE